MQHHYPERLHKVVMLRAPWVFGGFFALLKPFVDAKTYAKALFLRGDDEAVAAGLKELLGEGATPGLVPWLIREMRENRRSPFPSEQMMFWKDHHGFEGGKRESQEAVATSAGRENGVPHDPRGPASWVREYLLTRTPLSDKEGEECFCMWPGDAYPSPLIVQELTGVTVASHFRWRDEHRQ